MQTPPQGPVYWVDMIGGPLDGLRVALPMATAEDLRHHHKTATIQFGHLTRRGYVSASYRPAGRRKLAFVEWCRPREPERRGLPYIG